MDAPFWMKERSAGLSKGFTGRFRNGWSCLAVAAVFGWSSIFTPAMGQTPRLGGGQKPAEAQDDAPAAGAAGAPTGGSAGVSTSGMSTGVSTSVPPAAAAPEASPATPAPASAPAPAPASAPATPEAAPPAASVPGAPADPRELPKAPQAQAPDAELFTLSELEYLLGPVALYPDPLLAVMFPATAFPDQLREALKWIEDNPAAVKKQDFKAVDDKPWNASVQALTRFPDVVKLLCENADWTEALNFAFQMQPNDVSTAIQLLRAKAKKVGNLKTTPQQKVTTRSSGGSEKIYIEPANPERIYVPSYDSSSVFNTLAAGALVFGAAALVGSSWYNGWGGYNRPWNSMWMGSPFWYNTYPPQWGGGMWRPGWGGGWGGGGWGNGPWRPGFGPGWGGGPGWVAADGGLAGHIRHSPAIREGRAVPADRVSIRPCARVRGHFLRG